MASRKKKFTSLGPSTDSSQINIQIGKSYSGKKSQGKISLKNSQYQNNIQIGKMVEICEMENRKFRKKKS
jgi:hypothetical protein